MAQNKFGRNVTFPIYNADGTSFHGLELKKATVDSVVMSLGDKITGEVFYKDNTLEVTMHEYVVFKRNPEDANEDEVKYLLVNPPTIVREGHASDNSELKGMTKYAFEFYHPMYILNNIPFSDVAVTNDEEAYLSQNKKFTWIGYPDEYIAKLNKNLTGTQWVVVKSNRFPAVKDTILSGVLSFEKNTIADALKRGYEVWGVPYVIDVVKTNEAQYSQGKRFKVIFGLPSTEIYASAADANTNNPFIFRMGQGVGLKNNSRTPRNNKVITRISGYGSEDNIPYGYPQIVWTGDPSWNFTINNASGMQTVSVGGTQVQGMSYPIYDGIVGGQHVRLIKHPFTRTHLMPSIYTETVDKKVNPRNANYNPFIEIKDYYDAITSQQYPYVNEIDVSSPSYDIHEFDVKPEMNNGSGSVEIQDAVPLNNDTTTASAWDDTIDDDGNFVQSYFRIDLPLLSFDLYACASITQQMEINMRSGACLGCTFPVQVDWDEYKRNFYLADGTFDPVIHSVDGDGHVRDASRFPDTRTTRVSVIVQKENQTFGTIMPNIYQHPSSGDKFVVLGISLPLEYISSAESKLDEQMLSYMLENNLYYYEYPLKFDDYFLAQNTYILAQLKPNAIVRFAFGGLQEPLELYVKQLTIKYGYSVLPQYEITLTDNIEVVLNQIGQVAEDVEKLSSLISVFRESYSRNVWLEMSKKLSKVGEDTAQGNITFLQGLKAGQNGAWGWIKETAEHGFDTFTGGVAWFNNLLSSFFETAIAKVTNYLTGGDNGLVIKGNVGIQPTTNNGSDGNLYVHDDITAGGDISAPNGNISANNAEIANMLTTKNLTVTGLAHFFELVIDKIKAMGGSAIVTPVDGFTVEKVDAVTGGYKLYWTADDGEKGRYSGWKVGDQAICQTFNKATEIGVVNYDVSNTYYWSLVDYATDTPVDVTVDGETKKMHYITISNSVYDGAGQSAMQIPQVGDEIVMLGHRKQQGETDDEAKVRQTALYIAAYNSIDRGDSQNNVLPLVAPLFAFYKGINDFNLGSHRGTYLDANGSKFVGKFISSATDQDIESLLTGNEFNIIYGDGNPNVTQPHLAWTATEKLAHIGWLYFDLNLEPAIENGGRLWRWSQVEAGTGDDTDNDGYCWVCVTDIDTLAALDKIADVASDGKLSGGAEKVRVYLEWVDAKKTRDSLRAQAEEKGMQSSNIPYRYDEVANPTGNPHNKGYYVLSNGEYVVTQDTSVQSGTTYYEGATYSSAYTNLGNAFGNLSEYLNNFATYTYPNVPAWIDSANTTIGMNVTIVLPPFPIGATGSDIQYTGAQFYRKVWSDFYNAAVEMTRAINAWQYKSIEEMGDDGLIDPAEKAALRQIFNDEILYHFALRSQFDAISGNVAATTVSALSTLETTARNALVSLGSYMNGTTPTQSGDTWTVTTSWVWSSTMSNGLVDPPTAEEIAGGATVPANIYPLWLQKLNETQSEVVDDDAWDYFWKKVVDSRNAFEERIKEARIEKSENDVKKTDYYTEFDDIVPSRQQLTPGIMPSDNNSSTDITFRVGDRWYEECALINPVTSNVVTQNSDNKPLYNIYVCVTSYKESDNVTYANRFTKWELVTKPTAYISEANVAAIYNAIFSDNRFASWVMKIDSITSTVGAMVNGSKNLIVNSDFADGYSSHFSTSGTTPTLELTTDSDELPENFTCGVKMSTSSTSGSYISLVYGTGATQQPWIDLVVGAYYTMSLYLKNPSSSSVSLRLVYKDSSTSSWTPTASNGIYENFTLAANSETRKVVTFAAKNFSSESLHLGLMSSGSVVVTGVQLERGNSATAYQKGTGNVQNLQSQITQNATKIGMCVTKDGAEAAGIKIEYNAAETDGTVTLFGDKVSINGDLDLSSMNNLGEVTIDGDKLTINNDLDVRGLTTESVTVIDRSSIYNYDLPSETTLGLFPTIVNMGILLDEDESNPRKVKSVQMKAIDHSAPTDGYVDASSVDMIVLPFYDSLVGTEGSDDWSHNNSQMPITFYSDGSFKLFEKATIGDSKKRVVPWKQSGTRLTISNEYDHYMRNWENISVYTPDTSRGMFANILLSRCVLVCSDARLIASENITNSSNYYHGTYTYELDTPNFTPQHGTNGNTKDTDAGFFMCGGFSTRFIFVAPGQTLQLRSQISTTRGHDVLYWIVENVTDFVPLPNFALQFRHWNDSNAVIYSNGINDSDYRKNITFDPTEGYHGYADVAAVGPSPLLMCPYQTMYNVLYE